MSCNHYCTASEPHSYNIQAKLRNGVLSVYIRDTMTNLQWRQEFTQISFPQYKLYDIAKSLIKAIKQMINNNNNKTIGILVYNQWCYLQINNSNVPSFALRPINTDTNNDNNNPTTNNTNNNNNKQKRKQKQKQKQKQKPKTKPKPKPSRPLPPLHNSHIYSNSVTFGKSLQTESLNKQSFVNNINMNTNNDCINNINNYNNNCINHKKKKKQKKKRKKLQKQLKICLNGKVINDMITHAYEQQLAEEEYYDEEEDDDHDDDDDNTPNSIAYNYDPNYLGIAPYYDD